MMQYPLTLTSLFERAGKLFPQVEIVSRLPDDGIHRYTYRDWYRRAKALAAALQRYGIQRGDRVATLMWNHHAHLEAYFAAPVIGGVLHTLNLRLHPDELAFVINDAQDRILIIDDVLLPLFEQVKDRLNIERVIVFPFGGKPVPAGYEDYEIVLQGRAVEPIYPELDERDLASMCYTSGTTGKPKGLLQHCSLGWSLTSVRNVIYPLVPSPPPWGDVTSCIAIRDLLEPAQYLLHAWKVRYLLSVRDHID